jgi:hypothetical protein
VSEWNLLVTGVAPGHLPALIAALLLPLLVLGYRRLSGGTREVGVILRGDGPVPIPPPSPPRPPLRVEDRVAAWLLGLSAIVHLALPLGHSGPLAGAGSAGVAGRDEPGLTVAFLLDGAAFGILALRAATGRRWRPAGAALVPATLVGYLLVLGTGGEEPDQIGILTAMVELVILGLCLVPAARPARPRRVATPRRAARALGAAGLVLSVLVFGAVTWGLSFAAHADPVVRSEAVTQAGVGAGHGGHDHAGHAARAEAGVLMPPVPDRGPTVEQQRAAADLAVRTRASLRRFADIHAALAAGYRPSLLRTGYSVHLENKANGRDGRVLDPDRPEMLMYAIADGRATLLSAVYTMPRAGQAAPAPGGPLTMWHSHNACVSLLPPGFSVVDAYGGCPAFSVAVTMPVMMHVWVVDNPGGPYAEQVPDAWTRAFNAAQGVPFHW